MGKLGGENTKFFHAIATGNYRRNQIAMVKSDDGREINDHDQNDVILWKSFKNKLGKTDQFNMLFDLQSLIMTQELSSLEELFPLKRLMILLSTCLMTNL